jgi:putative membrane protein
MHTSVLGALLTFSQGAWYPTHAAGAAAHGTPALQDQQLAGVLMWVPSGALLTLIALGLFAAWLGAIERRVGTGLSSRIR